MADQKNQAAEGQNEADRAARRAVEADQQARKQAVEEGAKVTEEARAQDQETLKAQDEMRPYPSQEEADAMKSGVVREAVPYQTRDAKAK